MRTIIIVQEVEVHGWLHFMFLNCFSYAPEHTIGTMLSGIEELTLLLFFDSCS